MFECARVFFKLEEKDWIIKMKKVFAIADNIVSPLGINSKYNWDALLLNKSGVELQNKESISLKNFYSALFNDSQLEKVSVKIENPDTYTKLEKLFICSILDAASTCNIDLKSSKTLFLFSSTKGNIDLIESNKNSELFPEKIKLSVMAKAITTYFKNQNEPIVVSNACISGVLAIIIANYYIKEGIFNTVIVTGGDIISEFTISGFQSLYALSKSFCKPFDQERDGINLGEAAATIILSSEKAENNNIEINGGATSNDANHISGPSKTGDGLSLSIKNSLKYSNFSSSEIGFISGHGTATIYNDEMEAKALHLSNLETTPINSLKGYFGHTLGAAGILETIIAMHSIKNQMVIATRGYSEHGVSLPLNIIKENKLYNFSKCLKTASGFGGCNASIIFSGND